MIVEFLDGSGHWHVLRDASVERQENGVYLVTILRLAPMWLATPELFDGMLLRLDGREAKAIVDARSEDRTLVLRVCVDAGPPLA